MHLQNRPEELLERLPEVNPANEPGSKARIEWLLKTNQRCRIIVDLVINTAARGVTV